MLVVVSLSDLNIHKWWTRYFLLEYASRMPGLKKIHLFRVLFQFTFHRCGLLMFNGASRVISPCICYRPYENSARFQTAWPSQTV